MVNKRKFCDQRKICVGVRTSLKKIEIWVDGHGFLYPSAHLRFYGDRIHQIQNRQKFINNTFWILRTKGFIYPLHMPVQVRTRGRLRRQGPCLIFSVFFFVIKFQVSSLARCGWGTGVTCICFIKCLLSFAKYELFDSAGVSGRVPFPVARVTVTLVELTRHPT